MRTLKQFGYKLIVVLCVVLTLFIFAVSTPVSLASKVKKGEFYYGGTTKGSYTVSKSFWEKLLDALAAILDYLLGIMTMGIRVVFVGWTALLEQCLTWLLEAATGTEVNTEGVQPVGIADPDDYITIEAIVFNHVTLFNIDVFDNKVDNEHNSLGQELKKDKAGNVIEKSDISEDSFIVVLKRTIAGWYYTFRVISLMVMLILLIFIGVKLALASTIKQKALYKQVLVDWVVGLVLVFSIHYIILAMISFNNIIVRELYEIAKHGYGGEKAVYEYGIASRAKEEISNAELEESIYDEVRTRAYDAKLTVGTVGMILYMIIVFYAWKFSFIYLKRYFVVAVLVMMAPFVAVSYAYNKVRSGKTPMFTNWLRELFFMIMLQSIHALIYLIFFKQALALSLASFGGMIFAFIILNFMSKAEEIFRKIFNISGKLTNDVAGSKLKDVKSMVSSASLGVATSKTAATMTRGAARIATKPARIAANAGFGKIMEYRANRIVEKEKENERILANGGTPELTSLEKKKANRINRENKLRLGEMALKITSSRENITDEERAGLMKLRKAIPMKNANGSLMNEEEYIDNFYKNKESYLKKYNSTKYKYNLTNKWNEIMNPFQYVNKEADELDEEGNIIREGKYVRKKNKYEHENWGPLLKHLSKKQDGVGKTLFDYDLPDFALSTLNITKDDVKNIGKAYKTVITGFGGVLLGLPLAIVEPKVGFVFLAKGISENHKLFGGQNRVKYKNLKGFAMDHQGQYHFVGYSGKSVETMSEGMQAYARESAEIYSRSKDEYNKEVVRKVQRHQNLYENIMKSNYGANTHLVDSFRITSNPGRAFRTIATGNVLTGHLYQNYRMNTYLMFHESARKARKASAEHLEKNYNSTDKFLDELADSYLRVEEEKQALAQGRLSKEIGNVYSQEIENRIKFVDEMTDKRLLLEMDDSDEIKIEFINGKKRLSGSSEKSIIDKSIIEVAQKSGLVNLEEYDLEKDFAKVDQVKKVITDRLIKQGAIGKDQNAADIIEDLDKKILSQKQALQKNNPMAVQNKMIDDAIISEVKSSSYEGNDVNLEAIDDGAVINKVEKSIASIPTDSSAGVISSLNIGKQQQQQNNNRITSEAIQARKAIIASKLERSISSDERKTAKEKVKQQKLHELDKEIVSALNSKIEDNSSSIEEDDSASTDAVLQMLQLNTEKENSKKQLLEVSKKTSSDKKQMYIASLYGTDGRIDRESFAKELTAKRSRKSSSEMINGSKMAVNSYNSEVDSSIGNDDVLTIMKKIREQKNI